MARKSLKGGQYERECCRFLSVWFSGDEEQDDWFWRSSQSGGRATTRAKTGKRTVGNCGDVAAECPEAAIFTSVVTPEIKRGYNRTAHLADILEYGARHWKKPVEGSMAQFIKQAHDASKRASTPYWWIIHRRDKHRAYIVMPRSLWDEFCVEGKNLHVAGFEIYPNPDFYKPALAVVDFDFFLRNARPKTIHRLYRRIERGK